MSKKYKKYLWKDETIPIRTFSRYRTDVLSTDSKGTDNGVQSAFSDVSCEESEMYKMLNETTSGESSFNSTLSDKSELDTENENSSENSFSTKDDFQELIENANKPLYELANVTNLEAFVSILAYSIKFNLSKTCVDGLLKLLKNLLPPCNLPETKYLFYQGTSTISNVCELHLYCPHCDSYICKLCRENDLNECATCSESFITDELVKKGSFNLYASFISTKDETGK
ncbi:hypothetical protein AVEN_183309-1 [Araneus ventricosus]|uniref:Uncharacterized protein n=1 Tax=Araneus ventricosus TaxID=182803 RepID=A0A4Y2UF29_ARAVE|nr:hypothetical protein AVEN_183309-1 [Araneus ventricosus]